MGWWRALSLVILFMIVSACGTQQKLNGISTEGLTYDGTNIYYMGELAAVLKATEIGYDDNKIVRELTYEIVDAKFNPQGLSILKLLHEKQPHYDIEVEVQAIKVLGVNQR